jgi:glycosyltransferase involved in cell wall biosynthesis
MKISIITVAFNSAMTIGETLRSVASQTHGDIEHIVIDGASTDGTMEIVRREGLHLACVVSAKDRGIYDAMNKGLALATGEIVGFLNSDDVFESPDSVALIAEAFLRDTVAGVYGDLVFVDPKNVERVTRYWRPGPHVPGACAKGWMVPHPTFYVRRSDLHRVGGFDLDYKLQADFDLMLRLFEKERIKTKYLPKVLVRMRLGGATTGSFSNIIKGNIEAGRACKRAGFSGGLLFVARKMASRLPQFFARPGSIGIEDQND